MLVLDDRTMKTFRAYLPSCHRKAPVRGKICPVNARKNQSRNNRIFLELKILN